LEVGSGKWEQMRSRRLPASSFGLPASFKIKIMIKTNKK